MLKRTFPLILSSVVAVIITFYVVTVAGSLDHPSLLRKLILWFCGQFTSLDFAGRIIARLTYFTATMAGFWLFLLGSKRRLSVVAGIISVLIASVMSYFPPIAAMSTFRAWQSVSSNVFVSALHVIPCANSIVVVFVLAFVVTRFGGRIDSWFPRKRPLELRRTTQIYPFSDTRQQFLILEH